MMRSVKSFLSFGLLASIALLPACSDSDSPTGPGFERRLTLRVGQSVVVETSVLTIGFERIAQDSRCPIDAICVWAGEAKGQFFVFIGMGAPPIAFELSTLEPRTAVIQGYSITLIAVSPAPRSDVRIDPRDYKAELVISR